MNPISEQISKVDDALMHLYLSVFEFEQSAKRVETVMKKEGLK